VKYRYSDSVEQEKGAPVKALKSFGFGLLTICVLVLFASGSLVGQGIFATLTGVVSDSSGAVVGDAKITLTDSTSGSVRETVSNGDGFFTFASVPVGTYALTVEAKGFEKYKADDIRLGGGERRNVNAQLAVGATNQVVEVNAQDTAIATTDSGEKSFALETKELQNFTQVGSNAAEYIKIVPGFGIQNGTSNKSNYNGATIGINANGDSGSQSPLNAAFSYNGLPTNSLDITGDGAHVSDPGCNCDTPVNPNSDFVQEFKVLTSNFSAENQKGPILISSVTKAGGSDFHGSLFFSARNHSLNANDWLNNASNVKQPANVYYYPGATLGGPVIIPGTNFNKSRQKLFFFTGFEYYYQVLDTGLLRATVPPACELQGDFSPTCIAQEGNPNAAGKMPGEISNTIFPGYQIPMCTGTPNGKCIDPNMLALAKLYPAANVDPATTGGYNYTQSEVFNQNNRQWIIRGDWNISENTKVFVRYNYQREVQQFPVGLWWRNTDQVPYPTPIEGKNKSNSWSGTLTHVFSPTMTNETVVAYTFVGFPNVFADPNAVARSTVGYNYAGVFNNGVSQIPSFGQYGPSEAALVFNPGGFEAGGPSQGLYANKYMPSVSDTLTKVFKNHTIKAGFFWEWIRNAQPANNDTNGLLQVSQGSQFSYGNEYADLLTGNLSNYTETNFNRINNINYTTVEFFAQDSWKATRKLTIDFGMRFSHFTPWEDGEGFGYSIFDASQYSPDCAASPTFCGFEWHAKDHSVPIGGFPTRALFYQPRVGAAYDLRGTGKTVLRGGWGRFYYHSGQFTNGLDASAGVATANLSPTNWVGGPGCPTNPSNGSALFAYELSCLNVSASPASPAAVDSRDNNQPYTDSWSATVDQETPWQGHLEVSYVGNRSRDLSNTQGGAGSNINLVPLGAMLTASNPGSANANLYRVLNDPVTGAGYGDLIVATNNLYANYNALQVSWLRHAGRYTIQANYTFQKSLGIVNPTVDPFNLSDNYGALPSDRRHLFNLAFSIDAGTLVHSNKFVNGAVNGWQFSGIIQAESGANLTYGGNYTNTPNINYNMSLSCVATTAEVQAGQGCPNGTPGGAAGGPAIIPGSNTGANLLTGIPINNQSILGTNGEQLNPYVTCNPEEHLTSHQYVNSSCFSAPTTVGTNGPTMLPVAYGPTFFTWDQSIFKNFQLSESKKLQFRVSAYNWLNHPLYSFPSGNNLTLQFVQDPVTQQITQQNANFGYSTQKQGARVIQLEARFYF
jgi:Carboxypeptidase regulatory-like domain